MRSKMYVLGPQNDIVFENVEGSKSTENGSKNLKPGKTSKLVPILQQEPIWGDLDPSLVWQSVFALQKPIFGVIFLVKYGFFLFKLWVLRPNSTKFVAEKFRIFKIFKKSRKETKNLIHSLQWRHIIQRYWDQIRRDITKYIRGALLPTTLYIYIYIYIYVWN